MENKPPVQESRPEIGLATNQDLPGILHLQQENLGRNLSVEEKKDQGFVSLETSPELLEDISRQEGITVARINGKVVGYLMPMSIEQGKKAPLLDPFIGQFQSIQIDDKPLNTYKYCILGQVCIDKNHRGKGILEKLYQELETRIADKYDLGISEIGANNPRSLHTHLEKLGFKITKKYSANGLEWYIVFLDFRPFRKEPLSR